MSGFTRGFLDGNSRPLRGDGGSITMPVSQDEWERLKAQLMRLNVDQVLEAEMILTERKKEAAREAIRQIDQESEELIEEAKRKKHELRRLIGRRKRRNAAVHGKRPGADTSEG